jgi:hypothetical protein
LGDTIKSHDKALSVTRNGIYHASCEFKKNTGRVVGLGLYGVVLGSILGFTNLHVHQYYSADKVYKAKKKRAI